MFLLLCAITKSIAQPSPDFHAHYSQKEKRWADGPFVFLWIMVILRKFLFPAAAAVTVAAAAGGAGRAAAAATAAAALSLLTVPDHSPDDQSDDQSKNRNNDDITEGHSGHSFLFYADTPILTWVSAYLFFRKIRYSKPAKAATAAIVKMLNTASPVNRPTS